MSFDTWSEFIHMQGHGLYVWSAYFAVLVVFVFNVVQSLLSRKRVILEIRALARREANRSATDLNQESSE